MYPLPVLKRSRWETEVGLKRVIRALYGEARESAAKKAKQRENNRQRRHEKKQREKEESKERQERFKAELNQCQVASNQNDPAPEAQDVTDGAAAADGVADGAVAPVSLSKEQKDLLQDWVDKSGLERDKAQL